MLTQRRGSTDFAERRALQMPSAPLRRANNFANRNGFLLFSLIAAAGAIAFCGPL